MAQYKPCSHGRAFVTCRLKWSFGMTNVYGTVQIVPIPKARLNFEIRISPEFGAMSKAVHKAWRPSSKGNTTINSVYNKNGWIFYLVVQTNACACTHGLCNIVTNKNETV